MKTSRTLILIAGLAIFNSSCKKVGDETGYHPDIDPANFVSEINNKYFPLIPGTEFCYENIIMEGNDKTTQDITVAVTSDTKIILGVSCVVVHDVVKESGDIVEDTYDWYAQDKDGNVWYFGEDTKSYENGEISTEGSWTAGIDGAVPGILIHAPSQIQLGKTYYQEFYSGHAEDQATDLDTTSTAEVKYGTFNNCLRTREFTALEPGTAENKYYAPDVGLVLTVVIEGGQEREELRDIKP